MGKILLVVSLALLARPLSADALSDLKLLLANLQGRSEISATAIIEVWSESEEDQKKRHGKTMVELWDGPAGLRVTYPRAELQRADEEGRKSPEESKPTRTALALLDATALHEDVNFAVSLAQMLERAKIIERSDVTFQGKPATTLKLKVEIPIAAADRKRVKHAESILELRIGGDGIPITARQTSSIKVSLLLLKFESRETESMTFLHLGDRLIITEREEEQSASGLGQSTRTRKVTKLQLR